MPIVHVYRGQKQAKTARAFREALMEAVAEELSVPEGPLTKDDIIVLNRPFRDDDVHRRSFEIVVAANDYPERRAKIDAAANSILQKITPFIPRGCTAFVWVQLCPGGFAVFNPYQTR